MVGGLDGWMLGQSDAWSVGRLDGRTLGWSDAWSVGRLVRQSGRGLDSHWLTPKVRCNTWNIVNPNPTVTLCSLSCLLDDDFNYTLSLVHDNPDYMNSSRSS